MRNMEEERWAQEFASGSASKSKVVGGGGRLVHHETIYKSMHEHGEGNAGLSMSYKYSSEKRGKGSSSFHRSMRGSRHSEHTIVDKGSLKTVEKHGWKRKDNHLWEIIYEEEHIFILIHGEKYELFEGEHYWYYIDGEGEKHYIAFEDKREWVGKKESNFEGRMDEREVAWMEEEEKLNRNF